MSAADPPPWHLVVEFTGIDLDDDDVVEALVADPALHVEWSSSEGVTTAEATIPAASVEGAWALLLETVGAAAPEAEVLRIVDPLVTIVDIAEEAGVTRQAVRNWALGTRHSGFPRPLDVVGDGIRVWRHADVDAWLTATVNLGSGHRFPTQGFILALNEELQAVDEQDDEEGGDWYVASDVSETQSAVVERPSRRPARPSQATAIGR